MRDLIWLSEAQMRRIEPYFPLSHGVPRVDDRRIIAGIIFVIRMACAGVMRLRQAPQAVDSSLARLTEHGFELGERLLDGSTSI